MGASAGVLQRLKEEEVDLITAEYNEMKRKGMDDIDIESILREKHKNFQNGNSEVNQNNDVGVEKMTDMNHPNLVHQKYAIEILNSVYWQERASKHLKQNSDLSMLIDEAARSILAADAVLFVTGAGIGVDMGIPDFRSSNDFWKKLNRPDISRYEDASDDKWFTIDPEFAWGINYHQLSLYRSAAVHTGYIDMLDLVTNLKNKDYFCYTSNIDGVLQRVGFDRERVYECHGNIHRLQCTKYSCGAVWEGVVQLNIDVQSFRVHTESQGGEDMPRCPRCDSMARPNVWYCHEKNYILWDESRGIRQAYTDWLDGIEGDEGGGGPGVVRGGRRLVVVECGAGIVIPSSRIEAELTVERMGGRAALVRINPVDYMVPIGDPKYSTAVGIPLGAAAGLSRLVERVRELQRGIGQGQGQGDAALPSPATPSTVGANGAQPDDPPLPNKSQRVQPKAQHVAKSAHRAGKNHASTTSISGTGTTKKSTCNFEKLSS